MGISIGGGKGSGSSSATLTPEQKDLLQTQTGALKETFLPAYQNTILGAKDALYGAGANALPAMKTALNSAERTGQVAGAMGEQGLFSGTSGQSGLAQYQTQVGQDLLNTGGANLQNLFSPDYKNEQIQASLQPAREAAREAQAGQNAMYGAAGGLGSSRMALADRNLSSLNQQRMQSAAAQTSAAVESQRQQAANTLLGAGQTSLAQSGGLYGNLATQGLQGLTTGNQAMANRVALAQTPQDLLAKYASVVYGTPQASTTPNFTGTQGTNTSSKGFGVGSDLSIKENICKIGTLVNGLNLYKYEYKQPYKDVWGHGEQIGVIAQEVEKLIPEAVGIHADGYKVVNYSMVM